MPHALEIVEVSKSFGQQRVLNEVSLAVPTGSVVGLLGKNGAGKTTLLKCALGLLRPQHGRAEVLGRDAWTLDGPTKARLGYVPQTPLLYPWMKVGQIVEYTASFYPRWNSELVGRLLADWELPLEAKVGPLSLGQQQRLSIVLALGHEPEILVLDEPVAALDPEARREFLDLLLGLVGQGRTILFSTHITSDLERVAERVAILQGGRIRVDDDLDTLKDRVKRLRVHSAEPLPRNLALPGLLHLEQSDCDALLAVEQASPELVATLAERYRATVEEEPLNLEEIYLEVTRA